MGQKSLSLIGYSPKKERMKLNDYLKLKFISPLKFAKIADLDKRTVYKILKGHGATRHETVKEKVSIATEGNTNLNDPLDQ